jgi:ubiquinone/menaquinone biosynthesis C-methylase UbiE
MSEARASLNADELIREHYRKQAEKYGASPLSTMEDEVTREKELQLIETTLGLLTRRHGRALTVADIGCGNGLACARLVPQFPQHRYEGLDFTPELLTIARARGLAGCNFQQGDARKLPFGDAQFDFVYTERCLINLLEWEQQAQALREIARVLKPGGVYLMIEAFTDGLANNNRARVECGLDEVPQLQFNRFFDKDVFLPALPGLFRVVTAQDLDPTAAPDAVPQNFLSTYYFGARVIYPSVTKVQWVRNSEFAKFFSYLPAVGNYASIQAFLLQREA